MSRCVARWWWLVLILVLILGLGRLSFDVEVTNLLPAELPIVQGLKLHQKYFANADELIITVQSDDAETSEIAARQLCLIFRSKTNLVARALWQSPWHDRPDLMAEILALTWINQPPDKFAQLAERLSPDRCPAALVTARNALATSFSPDEIARLGYDPLGLSHLPDNVAPQTGGYGNGDDLFVSSDGNFRLIFLKPAVALGSYRACADWLERIRSSVEQSRSVGEIPANVRVSYTGAPAIIAETASGMEHDMTGSATGTLLVVAVLFWIAHRRLWPLCWLTILLFLVLGGTLALGGLIYGTLNVVSLGFAAILIGLTDDYPAVLYQEALDNPQLDAVEIRRRCTAPIAWSAVTTASAFLLLNFAGLPGLAQLGSLVALGVMLAAVVIIYGYLPVALKLKPRSVLSPRAGASSASPLPSLQHAGNLTRVVTCALPLVMLVLVWLLPPVVDHTAEALSPTRSPAYTAMKEVAARFSGNGEPIWILLSGRDEGEVAHRMDVLAAEVQQPKVRHYLGPVTHPSALWPRPECQQSNRVTAAGLARQRESLHRAFLSAGFNEEGFAFTDKVLGTWAQAGAARGVIWPTNEAGRWLLEKFAARTKDGWLALAIAHPMTNVATAYSQALAVLDTALADEGMQLTSWAALGDVLLTHTARRLIWVAIAMVALVSLCLWLAFRNLLEVSLSFATLITGLLSLQTVMTFLGWSWNLMNLMAVPLLLGAAVDYTIHTQLALRRNGGNITSFRRTTGRALLLGGATTIVGFGSLAWAGNAGLGSLGLVCSTGIACGLLVSLGLLPVWWVWLVPKLKVEAQPPETLIPRQQSVEAASAQEHPSLPSSSYRVGVWRVGTSLVQLLPNWIYAWLCLLAAGCYQMLRPQRREVVVENLLPVFDGNRSKADKAAGRLFKEFALKIADLWRFEVGHAMDHRLKQWSGWENFAAAQARGCGVLLVTVHLGNWELGGAFLARQGCKLLVLTQPEPGEGFTELRQQSRARWGIETLVIGENAFAFVEVIKRLQAGEVVAVLIDRPRAPAAVMVELFRRPFQASIAPAELARASGCALVPTVVVRQPNGYHAQLLPEIAYDRAAIEDRRARIQLTQEILRAFEPAIRQHPTQWFHFVPIWPQLERHDSATSELQ